MEEDVMIDRYLDAAGNERLFRLARMLYPTGEVLEAVELRDGEAVGMRFLIRCGSGEDTPWGHMRARIYERLAQRDVVSDPRSGDLTILNRVVRAQLTCDETSDDPALLVDDLRISWSELGQVLRSYEGFGLRLAITEAGEE